MNEEFQKMVIEVERLHGELMGMTPVKRGNLGECDFPGVYLFSENGEYLYVGRTRQLKKRLLQHSWSSPSGASFAFCLARKLTRNETASYKADAHSRTGLMKNEKFVAEFNRQRKRIAEMNIRFVRVDNETTQAMLEIYTSTVLKTPYNKFTTS